MKVGTPNTSSSLTTRSCSCRTALAGHPASTSANTASASAPARSRALRTTARSRRSPPSSWRAANRERWTGQELLGKPVPDHHAGRQRQQIGLLGRVLPRRGAALGNVGLIEEEGDEGHVPGGAGVQAVEKVLVAVAGERAPIVPGHGKLLVRAPWPV